MSKSSSGRKPIQAAEIVEDPTNHAAVARAGQAANTLAVMSAEIAERFGDGLPYDRARVVHEARFYAAQSAEAMLELGKRLIQIKENEPHGEFLHIVTEQLGIGARSGQLMMQAAAKYLAPALAPHAKSISLLGRTKLFMLMAEDDESLRALAEGGTLAGHELDEIDAMPASELRAALRKEREEKAAKQRVIDSKNRTIDRLQEAEEARRAAPLPEQERLQLDDLREVGLAAETALQRLLHIVDQVMTAPATEAAELCARQTLEYTVQRLVDGCNDRRIAVDLAERVTPQWAAEINALVDAAPTRSTKAKR